MHPTRSNAGFSFQCFASEGAILALPDGGSREDLREIARFREYAAQNAESWYKYVNGSRGRDAENGSIYLVTGCDKCKSWGVASFCNVSRSFNLTFTLTAADGGNTNDTSTWEHSSSASTHCGPVPIEYFNDARPQNQCTFIRGFKISLSHGLWATLFGRVTEVSTIVDAKPDDILTRNNFVPFSSGSSWVKGSFFRSSSERFQENEQASEGLPSDNIGVGAFGSDVIITSDVPPASCPYHPSNIINEHILEKTMHARVAITHDNDWRAVIGEDENSIPNGRELLDRVYAMYDVRYENGAAFLVSKETKVAARDVLAESNSSQQPKPLYFPATIVSQLQRPLFTYRGLSFGPTGSVNKFAQFLNAGLFQKYKKKALLIGISDNGDSKDVLALEGPHHDVRALQELIISQYGYNHEDVVVMLDCGVVEGSLAPTRANILREIQNLVKGAQPGDRFLFHFSGHSQQVVNEIETEEDGFDEALIAGDGKILIDNTLRQYLVDPLPVDCSLVAILDTCHSTSLLDLPHHKCNRIYVPWVSKESSIQLSAPQQQTSIDSMPSTDRSLSVRTSSLVTERPAWISINTHLLQMSPIQETTPLEQEEGFGSSSILLSPVMRCTSPHPQPALQCDGFDLCGNGGNDVAHVIALGACRDAQVAWEDNGESLTVILIDILKKDPYPRLKDMMRVINHRTYDTVCRLHEIWRKWQIEYNKGDKRRLTDDEETQMYRMIERENPLKGFQDPQLASHRKLDMDSFFTL